VAQKPESPVGLAPESDPARRRRQGQVVGGLFLTFAGLFLVAILFPVPSDALVRAIPVVGAGLFFLWLGGVLMGRGSGQRLGRARN
jgi:VIT1/CCC1 family predicted Fe2+/Mn2+ transporter